jgi:hypothetical protein
VSLPVMTSSLSVFYRGCCLWEVDRDSLGQPVETTVPSLDVEAA